MDSVKIKMRCTRKQRQFLHAVIKDDYYQQLGFGGARGGAKTFISCLAMVLRRLKFAKSKGLMLRLTQGAADQNIGESIEKVCRLLGLPLGPRGIHWVETKKAWLFPNGSGIYLGYCKNEKDWQRWQGQQFMDICFEEATQFPERVFLDIIGSNRNENYTGTGGKIWITCNPGGLGTTWVKKRFIDEKTRDPRTLWIKAVLRDNPALLEDDPGYRDRTLAKQPEWRRAQWEDGDWDSIEGLFWNINRVEAVRKLEVPYWADITAGVDAGFYPSAFATVWIAKWRDEYGKLHIHVMRELKRQRLNTSQQAAEALAVERQLPSHVKARFADPAAWKRTEADGGITATTAHAWATKGFVVAATYSNASQAGWMLLRTLFDEKILTIDPECWALLKEFEDAIHDTDSDDMAPNTEDHCLDALRYAIVSVVATTAPGELLDPYAKREGTKTGRIERKIIMLSKRED